MVTLSTEVTGSNIAYIYYYVSYYWEATVPTSPPTRVSSSRDHEGDGRGLLPRLGRRQARLCRI